MKHKQNSLRSQTISPTPPVKVFLPPWPALFHICLPLSSFGTGVQCLSGCKFAKRKLFGRRRELGVSIKNIVNSTQKNQLWWHTDYPTDCRGCRPTKTARRSLRTEAETEAEQAVDGLHKVFIKNFCNGTKNCQLTNWHPRKQHKLLHRPFPSSNLLWSVADCTVVVVVAVSAAATECRTKIAVNFEEGIKNKLTIFCARFATVHTHTLIYKHVYVQPQILMPTPIPLHRTFHAEKLLLLVCLLQFEECNATLRHRPLLPSWALR